MTPTLSWVSSEQNDDYNDAVSRRNRAIVLLVVVFPRKVFLPTAYDR